ncbi:MAG: hypothetical protein QM523_11225, partial [Candidatus Pacebacteria bacterium]|nr:hypothetical protein [Candidatus Paceibacterota bacterium]
MFLQSPRLARPLSTMNRLALGVMIGAILAMVSGCAPAMKSNNNAQNKKAEEEIFDPGDFATASQPTPKKPAKEPAKPAAPEVIPEPESK